MADGNGFNPLSLLGGVANTIIGAPIQNIFNKKSEKRNFEYTKQLNEQQFGFQQQLQEQQNAFNLDMWNKNNEYNDPSSQVARYRAAGLNPAMMMGNNSAAVSQPLESASPNVPGSNNANFAQSPSIDAFIAQGINADLTFKEQKLREKLLDKQLAREDKRIDIESKKAMSEVGLNEILGRSEEQKIELSKTQQEQLRSSIVSMNKNLDVMDSQIQKTNAEIEQIKANAEKARQEGKYISYNAITARMNAISQRITSNATNRLYKTQESVNDSQVHLNKEQCHNLVVKSQNMQKEGKLLDVECEWKGKQYKADFEIKQGQLRIVNIEGDIKDATQYAEIGNAYINTLDNAFKCVSDGAAAVIDVTTAGATTTVRNQQPQMNQFRMNRDDAYTQFMLNR